MIVNATNDEPAIYSLREFVEPRRTLLKNGRLSGFREYELSGETALLGHIVQRTSRYEKVWIERGLQMRGGGTKIFSFVQTPQGWRIASVLWHDGATNVVDKKARNNGASHELRDFTRTSRFRLVTVKHR